MAKLFVYSIFTAALLLPAQAINDDLVGLETLPNIDYLASGYNLFYGNPHSTRPGADPGFT